MHKNINGYPIIVSSCRLGYIHTSASRFISSSIAHNEYGRMLFSSAAGELSFPWQAAFLCKSGVVKYVATNNNRTSMEDIERICAYAADKAGKVIGIEGVASVTRQGAIYEVLGTGSPSDHANTAVDIWRRHVLSLPADARTEVTYYMETDSSLFVARRENRGIAVTVNERTQQGLAPLLDELRNHRLCPQKTIMHPLNMLQWYDDLKTVRR